MDEAQGFSANPIGAMFAHLAPDHSVTFVLDAAQRDSISHYSNSRDFRSRHRHQSRTLPEPGPAPSPLQQEGYTSLTPVTSTRLRLTTLMK